MRLIGVRLGRARIAHGLTAVHSLNRTDRAYRPPQTLQETANVTQHGQYSTPFS